MDSRKKIIFGATKILYSVLQYIDIDEIYYIVDNDENKKEWETKKVYLPDKLKEENKDEILVIVVSTFYNEIRQQLLEMGLRENIEFINGRQKYRLDIQHFSCYKEGLECEDLVLNYFVDQIGFTILSKKNDRVIYRGIYHGMEEHVQYVLQTIKSSSKLRDMIVETQISELNFDTSRFSMMLEHQKLKGYVIATEWSPHMFHDAIKFMIELMRELGNNKLGLKDLHMYNMARVKTKWVFFDFGSIIRGETRKDVLNTFISFAINPYILMKKGCFYKANFYLEVMRSGNSEILLEQRDVISYLTEDEKMSYSEICDSKSELHERLDQISEFIENIHSEVKLTAWGDYQHALFKEECEDEKGKKIIEFVKETHPHSILDLAGNAGGYGYKVLKSVQEDIRYTFMDYDFSALDAGYQIRRDKNCLAAMPCFKDFKKIDCETARRHKADLVLVLALIHHLVFSQSLTFRTIVDIIESCTKQYYIIEFSDETYLYVKQWTNPDFSWYTLENLIREISKNSEVIKIDNYNGNGNGRILVYCKKGNN